MTQKTLLVIFPHPDDESVFAAAAILEAKRAGQRVILITLTRGEAGQNYLGLGDLATIRTNELQTVAKILQVDELIVGAFSDGKLRETQKAWYAWLKQKINHYRPDRVITYDPSGITGHPDHISVTQAVIEFHKIFEFELWLATVPKSSRIYNRLIESYLKPYTLKLDTLHYLLLQWRAIKAHASQNLSKSFFHEPVWLALVSKRYEWYHQYDPKLTYDYAYIDFEI